MPLPVYRSLTLIIKNLPEAFLFCGQSFPGVFFDRTWRLIERD
jgi:hypothetical protein